MRERKLNRFFHTDPGARGSDTRAQSLRECLQILFIVVEVRRDPQMAAPGGDQDSLLLERLRQDRHIAVVESSSDDRRGAVRYGGAVLAQNGARLRSQVENAPLDDFRSGDARHSWPQDLDLHFRPEVRRSGTNGGRSAVLHEKAVAS